MDSRRERSILIIDGDCQLSMNVLRCLASVPGLKVHVLTSEPNSKARFSRHCASSHLHDSVGDDKKYIETIAKVAKRVKADVLLPVAKPGILFAIRNASALVQIAPLPPLPNQNSFDVADDKWKLAKLMQEKRIPAPKTIFYSRDVDFEQKLDSLTFPVLIKPPRSSYGTRIQMFEDRESLEGFLRSNREDTRPYILQNEVKGYDIDCSVLCKDGRILAHTIQKCIVPNPVPFRASLAIEFVQSEEVLQVATRLIRALNFNGVAHIDLMVDARDGSVQVIEVNPRYWLSLPGSQSAGVNFPQLACLSALGSPFPKIEYKPRRYIDLPGILKKWLYRPPAPGVAPFRFSEIDCGYCFTDPWPLVPLFWKKLWKSQLRSQAQRMQAPL
jgi:D-aspartate ligase